MAADDPHWCTCCSYQNLPGSLVCLICGANRLLDPCLAKGEAAFTVEAANALDAALGPCRRESFLLPRGKIGAPLVYLCGNSLGLQPQRCSRYIAEELEKWGSLGVEGHFTPPRPWVSIDETVSEGLAALVGAAPSEVVVMNTLSSNLHILMCSFYRPSGTRTRILLEDCAFPSDSHVAQSQAALHGLDPAVTLLRMASLRTEDVVAAIRAAGDTLALVLLPGVQYYTGQRLDIAAITAAAHSVGAYAAWDLAHSVGNVPLELSAWGVDFAAWCSYKYLNSGPGGIAGAFVHSRHGAGGQDARFRLAGWWGHTKDDRFQMRQDYVASAGAQGFQLSNPSVLGVAALRASLDEFQAAGGIGKLRERSLVLTGYLLAALRGSALFSGSEDHAGGGSGQHARWNILTPAEAVDRGCQLSLEVPLAPGCPTLDALCEGLREEGVIVDERKVRLLRHCCPFLL